jgi:hypothetical protein
MNLRNKSIAKHFRHFRFVISLSFGILDCLKEKHRRCEYLQYVFPRLPRHTPLRFLQDERIILD